LSGPAFCQPTRSMAPAEPSYEGDYDGILADNCYTDLYNTLGWQR
jgi:hypothetical protein